MPPRNLHLYRQRLEERSQRYESLVHTMLVETSRLNNYLMGQGEDPIEWFPDLHVLDKRFRSSPQKTMRWLEQRIAEILDYGQSVGIDDP